MLVATFGPTSGWAGKTITHENGQFQLEGFGPITAQSVLDYDGKGQLDWAYEELRGWVREVAGSSSAATLHPAAAGMTQQHKPFPGWAIALIVIVALLFFAALVVIALVPWVPVGGQTSDSYESAVKEGIHSLQVGVQSWAVDHDDAYPDPSVVTPDGLGGEEGTVYLDFWPTNPYTGAPMAQGTGPGDFEYTLDADGGFTLVGYGSDGEAIIIVP